MANVHTRVQCTQSQNLAKIVCAHLKIFEPGSGLSAAWITHWKSHAGKELGQSRTQFASDLQALRLGRAEEPRGMTLISPLGAQPVALSFGGESAVAKRLTCKDQKSGSMGSEMNCFENEARASCWHSQGMQVRLACQEIPNERVMPS